MASMAMTSCASLSAPLVSMKTPSKVVGLGSVSFAVPKKPFLKSGNLVVRAGESGRDIIDVGDHVDVPILEINADSNQSWALDRERPLQRVPIDMLPYGIIESISHVRSEMVSVMDRLLAETTEISKKKGGVLQPRIPWEVMDSDTEYKIRFDMPGVAVGNAKVHVEDKNLLVIKGEPKKEKGLDSEWAKTSYYASYDTWFRLPESCQVDKIDAKIKDGVLYITVPKIIPSEAPKN